MSALLRLTAEFGDAYRREKLRQNAADFSDQEHLALKILVNGDGTPTEMGEQAAARYREVLVDEYQDTNEVQNHIFRAVSNGGQNIFTVGDVKQSIYRFRLADPTIFLRKYTTFKEYTEASDGEERKILLSKNFRSRREILDAANFVFENILSVEMGEMEYGDEEALHFGAEYYPERRGCDTEFHLITARQKTEEDPRPVKKTVAEARFAAARIRQLLDERYGVTGEDGAPRPCVPEDFAILMRSPGSRAAIFADALAEQDLPCSFEESGDFFTTMRAHSATHLLDAALQRILGEHVHQAGSLVEPDRLRFDFTHFNAISPAELSEISRLVNDEILEGLPVTTQVLPVEDAKKLGATAIFGEKYGKTVRVVSMSSKTEQTLISTYALPDIEALVVGHHGSKSSTSEELLDALLPEVAAISVGSNSYGHPTPQTLHRLTKAGVAVYRTDRQGTIHLSVN